MNCLALGLKKRGQGNKILRYISVENNERARKVAQAANCCSPVLAGLTVARPGCMCGQGIEDLLV